MKIRLPRFYYVLRCKISRFISRNWTGCEYCNEETLLKRLSVDADSLGKLLIHFCTNICQIYII